MLEKLFSIFNSSSIHRISFVVSLASNIIKAIDQECATDTNAKDTIIDVLIALLQKSKSATSQLSTSTPAPGNTPTPTNTTIK